MVREVASGAEVWSYLFGDGDEATARSVLLRLACAGALDRVGRKSRRPGMPGGRGPTVYRLSGSWLVSFVPRVLAATQELSPRRFWYLNDLSRLLGPIRYREALVLAVAVLCRQEAVARVVLFEGSLEGGVKRPRWTSGPAEVQKQIQAQREMDLLSVVSLQE